MVTEGNMDIDDKAEQGNNAKSWFPTRYLVVILGSLGLLPTVGARKVFALVMTHLTATGSNPTEEIFISDCPVINSSLDMRMDMTVETMFLVHSAYYTGFITLCIAASILGARFSPTRLVALATMVSGLLSVCLPFTLMINCTPLLILIRFLQGAMDSAQQPSSLQVLAAWSTDRERARFTTIYFAGSFISPAVASLLTTVILCYVSWHGIFFIYGGMAVLWSLLWIMVVYDTPEVHPSLSKEQRRLHRDHGARVQQSSRKTHSRIPWRHILTCPTVWVAFASFFSRSYIYTVLVVEQAQYYYDSFNINMADIGLLSALPHVGLTLGSLLGGVIADLLLRTSLSLTSIRKLNFTAGKLTESVCLLGLYFTTDLPLAVSLLSIGVAVGGLADAGIDPLPFDLAPQYASVIFGIAGTGIVSAVISTVLASLIPGKDKTIQSWQTMFLIAGVLDLLNVAMFDAIVTAELQPWASGTSPTATAVTSMRNTSKDGSPPIETTPMIMKGGRKDDIAVRQY